eukprot:scaffold85762_cov15-Tisochrysis_lutea.AAC.1
MKRAEGRTQAPTMRATNYYNREVVEVPAHGNANTEKGTERELQQAVLLQGWKLPPWCCHWTSKEKEDTSNSKEALCSPTNRCHAWPLMLLSLIKYLSLPIPDTRGAWENSKAGKQPLQHQQEGTSQRGAPAKLAARQTLSSTTKSPFLTTYCSKVGELQRLGDFVSKISLKKKWSGKTP